MIIIFKFVVPELFFRNEKKRMAIIRTTLSRCRITKEKFGFFMLYKVIKGIIKDKN